MFRKEDSIKAANQVKLAKEEQDDLLKQIRSSEDEQEVAEAKTLLKSRCGILILSVVEKYLESGLYLTELARLGEKGLDEAIKKWDIKKKKKYRFAVYATWFIRAEIHKKLGLPTDVEGYGEIRKEK